MKTRAIKRYGWHRDLPDQRDFNYSSVGMKSILSPNADLRPLMPPVYNQGQLGSCTANAISGAIEFELMRQKADIMPSRLFIYYNERAIEDTISSDSGAQIRDGIKSVVSQGVCPEAEWPYIINKFAEKPPLPCYTDAIKDKVISYFSVKQDITDMCTCLATGFPFVFGFTVYESFESEAVANSGIVQMPLRSESVIGGHAVLCVGYDHARQLFICRNSWGDSWGLKGYFEMPYAYFLNPKLASDMWTIRVVA